ncbi:MAG: right-handed parallel beta-helix repeat-containing protein [Acidobacteria bacterium]|nr:right-handed parallel beta-helix repeat-containing protein [Acidobacteriota bacterium]
MNTGKGFFGKCMYLFVALVILLPSWGVAETLSVNCNAGGSIGEALTTLKPGDTLLVSGTCLEDLEVNGQTGEFDGITLDGQGTATLSGPSSSRDNLRLVAVRGVTVRGFRFTGGRDAIHVRWSTMVFILNNTIEQMGRNGIAVTRGAWAHISDNVIQNNPRNGIQVEESTVRIGGSLDEPPQPAPNLIQGNGVHGILVNRTSVARILGNTIRNNGEDGISVVKMSQADIGSNTIEGNTRNGIRAQHNSGVNLGADTGTGLENSPNRTTVPNGQYGLDCSLGAYADGRLGSLTGTRGATNFTDLPINSLLP